MRDASLRAVFRWQTGVPGNLGSPRSDFCSLGWNVIRLRSCLQALVPFGGYRLVRRGWNHALVYLAGGWHISRKAGAGRRQVVFHRAVICLARRYANPRGVNALLRHKGILGVDRPQRQ